MKKTILITVVAITGAAAGAVGLYGLAHSIVRAKDRGEMHHHPIIKSISWAHSKVASRNFDPNTENWEK